MNELKLLEGDVTVFSDNQSLIFLSKNPIFYDRSKHIGVKYHSDMVTKVLPVNRFKRCLDFLNIELVWFH